MKFTKMEGLGNDYIYVDLFTQDLGDADLGALAKRVSDRHFGIGSDGLVLIGPSSCADCRMQMFNSDGSEAELCGNAVRCIAKLMLDMGRSNGNEVSIETLAGRIVATIRDNTATQAHVAVDMGTPRLAPGDIPVDAAGERAVGIPLEAGGKTLLATCVSMGNPHCVVFVDEPTDELVHTTGPLLEGHVAFPNKTNVEFAEVIDREHVRMRVWERGAGETLACGTGACATAVACVLNGLCDRHVFIDLLGGRLEIEWREDGHVQMTGPATIVFTGEIII